MDSARSPNDPSAYFESLMQAGQQSFKQFDDAIAQAMGVSGKAGADKSSSPFVAAIELQRDSILQAGIALQQAGVIPANVDVKKTLDDLVDDRFVAV